MAQLPPKIPNISSNWPNSQHQRAPSVGNFLPNNNQPSWVDEFLEFSSAKCGSHRRSVSDSATFVEGPVVDECPGGVAEPEPGHDDFDKLDDEQLMSMFSDEMSVPVPATTVSSSNPSTSSDHNSNNEEKPTQTDQHVEVQSSCKVEEADPMTMIDPKRVKRILANRQSAQRSRVRKLQYISELERSVNSLQTEVSTLSPRVAFLDHQRLVLNVDNSALKQRIAALAQDKIFKDAHQEALKEEIERLRQVYHQQNMKKMVNPSDHPHGCTDRELHN